MTIVFTLTHHHKHGHGVTVYSSKGLALLGAADRIAIWTLYVHTHLEQRREIAQLLNERKYEKALKRWSDIQDTETLHIDQTVIDAGVPEYHPTIDIVQLEEDSTE